MSRYLPLTSTTTFLCETCKRRFPASQLYGKWPRKRDLARGIAHAAQPPYWIHRMVCSWACEQQAPKRTLRDLYAVLGWPPAPEAAQRPQKPPGARQASVSQGEVLAGEIAALVARGTAQTTIARALGLSHTTRPARLPAAS